MYMCPSRYVGRKGREGGLRIEAMRLNSEGGLYNRTRCNRMSHSCCRFGGTRGGVKARRSSQHDGRLGGSLVFKPFSFHDDIAIPTLCKEQRPDAG